MVQHVMREKVHRTEEDTTSELGIVTGTVEYKSSISTII